MRRAVALREFEADMCIRVVNGRGTRHDKTGQGYDQMIRATTEEGNYRQVNFNKQNLLRSAGGPQRAGNVATSFDWLRRGLQWDFGSG